MIGPVRALKTSSVAPHRPPSISREWVIFYGAGVKPTGGYDANILSLTRAGDTLTVVTRLVSPGSSCDVTQSLTSPHVLIKLASQSRAAIAFLEDDSVDDCGASPCAAVLCPVGSRCEVQQVQCIKAP